MQQNRLSLLAYSIWFVCAMYFFLHYFARVTPTLIQGTLMRDFSANAEQIGIFGSSFYLGYMLMQMPVGFLVDSLGPKKVLPLACIVTAISLAIFSQTTHLGTAIGSQISFGLAAAFAFVGALKVATQWFPSDKLAMLVGWTQGLGMLAGMLATALMPKVFATAGWRPVLLILGGCVLVLAIIMHRLLRIPAPFVPANQTEAEATTAVAAPSAVLQVLMHWKTWAVAAYCGAIFAPTLIIFERWGSVYFHGVQAMSDVQCGLLASVMFTGWCLGSPLCGLLADRFGRKPVMAIGALACLLFFYPLSMMPGLSFPILLLLSLGYGLTNASLIAAYTVAGEIHPPRSAGLSMSIANMLTVLVGAALNVICAQRLDALWSGDYFEGTPVYLAENFTQAFASLPVCLIVAFVLALSVPETLRKG